jgi:arginyl-tRNA synthetase
MKNKIKQTIDKAIETLQKEGKFAEFEMPDILVEYPKEKNHGDYSTNVSLQIAKIIKKKPLDIANILADKLIGAPDSFFEKVEAVAPGFINFFISKDYLQEQVKEILKQKEKFGTSKIGNGQKTNVEFISANPTGPLTLGNGRGGFCGDVLANVLDKAGYKVTREYYINDRGEQIIKLGHSVLRDEQAVYKGDYINDLRKKIKGNDPEKIGEKAANIILTKMIKPAIKRMGIGFDVWFSEKSLYVKKAVDKAIDYLSENRFTYKSEGAVWFKCKEFGDDKDRVLVRKDGVETYFASDIAYLKNKIERGFDNIIIFLGADHYGYVARLKAAAEVLGFDKDNLDAIVMQMVRLFENGKEVKMSKRTGNYITLDELFDEVSLDVARFFFLTRSSNTHLNFDLNLAKEQSAKNPVYYVQYAHARICSILKKSKTKNTAGKQNVKLLNHQTELNLIKQLIKLPEVIEDTAKDYQVQRLPHYAVELADAFHQFYENCRVITEDKNLSQARLSLVLAVKIILKDTLDLMGISAPAKM